MLDAIAYACQVSPTQHGDPIWASEAPPGRWCVGGVGWGEAGIRKSLPQETHRLTLSTSLQFQRTCQYTWDTETVLPKAHRITAPDSLVLIKCSLPHRLD